MRTQRARQGSTTSGSKRGRWSLGEQRRLEQLYGLRDEEVIARELRRPVDGVRRMAQKLFSALRSGPWQQPEIDELKRYLGAASPDVIARILGRRIEEVRSQIQELDRVRRVDPVSRQELAKFKSLYGCRTDENLARIFGRPIEDIRKLASDLCLSKDKAFLRRLSGLPETRMPRWSHQELARLARDYATNSNLDIARELRRSVKSVTSKAHQLGLKKSGERLAIMGRNNVRVRYDDPAAQARPI